MGAATSRVFGRGGGTKREQASKPRSAIGGAGSRGDGGERSLKSSGEYEDVACERCGDLGDEGKILLCDRCDRGFHTYCLCPMVVCIPPGEWFCPDCAGNKRQKVQAFPLNQTKICDFFNIERGNLSGRQVTDRKKKKKQKRPRVRLVTKRCSSQLLPYVPSKDPWERMGQMASLATAIQAAGATYTPHNIYSPAAGEVLERGEVVEEGGGGIPELAPKNVRVLDECERMLRAGEPPPLVVIHCPVEGFAVEAADSIREFTLICEYAGEVDALHGRAFGKSDSLMDLVWTGDVATSLVVDADRYCNASRFVNGVNNYEDKSHLKINVRSLRAAVEGEVRIFLVANRHIAKGERLYYDYNGQMEGGGRRYHRGNVETKTRGLHYPTEHFV